MIIKKFDRRDLNQIFNLLRETILTINLGDYSKKQVELWAKSVTNIVFWEERLEQSFVYVAAIDREIVGLGSFSEKEVDLLYTHKDYQRQGIASKLLSAIEKKAKTEDLVEIYTEASITAKPFFESHGYTIMKKQTKNLDGIEFINFLMKKNLK